MTEKNETEEKSEIKVEKKEQKTVKAKDNKNVIFTMGKRKRAVARARIRSGTGIITINQKPINLIENQLVRMKVMEPVVLIGDKAKGYDIKVNVCGGGILGQIDAARQAIARCFVKIYGEEIEKMFLSYDRNLLVYDPRRTETHKPPRSSQGPRRYKQRSKR